MTEKPQAEVTECWHGHVKAICAECETDVEIIAESLIATYGAALSQCESREIAQGAHPGEEVSALFIKTLRNLVDEIADQAKREAIAEYRYSAEASEFKSWEPKLREVLARGRREGREEVLQQLSEELADEIRRDFAPAEPEVKP